jgi:hypothetical protein
LTGQRNTLLEFVFRVSFLTDTGAFFFAVDIVLIRAAGIYFVCLATAVLEAETISALALQCVLCNGVLGTLSALANSIETTVAESATALAFSVGIVEMGFLAVSGFAGPIYFCSSVGTNAFVVFVYERRFASIAEPVSVVAGSTPSRARSTASIGLHKLSS